MFRSPICWVFGSDSLDVSWFSFPEGLLQLVLQFLVELSSLWGCGTRQRMVGRDLQCAFLVMSTKQHVWHLIHKATRIISKNHQTLNTWHVISQYNLQVEKGRKRGGDIHIACSYSNCEKVLCGLVSAHHFAREIPNGLGSPGLAVLSVILASEIWSTGRLNNRQWEGRWLVALSKWGTPKLLPMIISPTKLLQHVATGCIRFFKWLMCLGKMMMRSFVQLISSWFQSGTHLASWLIIFPTTGYHNHHLNQMIHIS